VIDGNDKDNEDSVIEGEDRPVRTDAAGIERHVFVALEFLDTCLRVLFGGKLVQGCADPTGIFFWEIQEIFLSPAREVNCVHLNPVRVAELVQFAGLFIPDIGKPFFDCLQGILTDHLLVYLGFHEPCDDFIVGFPRVCPEFRERFLGLFPDPDGDAFHV
jgi:hypothetical protein